MDLKIIREIAQRHGYTEIDYQPNIKMISFKKTFIEKILPKVKVRVNLDDLICQPTELPVEVKETMTCRLNIYYSTMTVGTCLNHPKKGKTQLFRKNVWNVDLLENLFFNPRFHTRKGYYKKRF